MSEIESGRADPSLQALVSIATALGRRVSVQLLPDRDPLVRDHRQAPMVEELIRRLDSRWSAAVEVAVYRPIHGVIDLVLTDLAAKVVVCVEVQSEIRRLEQQIRWATQKAHALLVTGPMADSGDGAPRVFQVLALASTRRNREIVGQFEATVRVAYPSRPEDIVSALTDHRPWPGSGLVWLSVHGRSAHLLSGAPRRLSVQGRSAERFGHVE